MLEALVDFACKGQAIVFTHHRHIAERATRLYLPEILARVSHSLTSVDDLSAISRFLQRIFKQQRKRFAKNRK